MRALSLFSGIGGIDLACEWAGIKTVAFCEREPFPQNVLRKHWPHVPIYDDVCTLTKERLDADGIRAIELIHGGYPCQPFSHAGKRRGKEDDRHLWPEVRRLVEAIRPRWFVGENVAGHVSLGLDDVLSDLEAIGYTAKPFIIPAAAIGAPHRRDRVFIVGYTERGGCRGESWRWAEQEPADGRFGMEEGNVADTASKRFGETRECITERSETWIAGSSKDVADPSSSGQQECDSPAFTDRSRYSAGSGHAGRTIGSIESRLGGMLDGISARLDRFRWPAGRGQYQHSWEPPRVRNGVRNRSPRLKSLGNAVVPLQIYPIFAAIMQIEAMNIR